MHFTFTKEPLHIDDVVVYLKNERTGSSTIRKCKFIGQIVGFKKSKVEIMRLSYPDTFAFPEECQQHCIDNIDSNEIIYIILSKYQENSHIKTIAGLNEVIDKQRKDIKWLIGKWFSALEDEGVNPWADNECIEIANKYLYTEEDYKKYLSTII